MDFVWEYQLLEIHAPLTQVSEKSPQASSSQWALPQKESGPLFLWGAATTEYGKTLLNKTLLNMLKPSRAGVYCAYPEGQNSG